MSEGERELADILDHYAARLRHSVVMALGLCGDMADSIARVAARMEQVNCKVMRCITSVLKEAEV